MRLRLLVLTVSYPNDVAYYWDWVDAFKTHPDVTAEVLNIGTAEGKKRLPALMRAADAIVALHSTNSDWLADLLEVTPALLDRRVPLAVFVGNEYNNPFPWLAEKLAAVKGLAADIVISQLLLETAEWLYSKTGARILSLPHALNPRRFYPGPAQSARRFDVASRSSSYPIYVGDSERNDTFSAAMRLQTSSAFAIDIRLDERLSPDAWADLLRDSRATLSTEAGTWYLEDDDRTARQVEQLLHSKGRVGFVLPTWLRRWLRQLPAELKDLLRRTGGKVAVTYAPWAVPDPGVASELADFFARIPKAPFYGKCISSRHFDALGTKTLQLLTPGRYNDILRRGEHYLEIASDGSNLREIVEMAQDPAVWTRVTESGFELGQKFTYSTRLDQLVSALVNVAA
jgi:hypothetical protein